MITFRSKVDTWLGMLLGVGSVVQLATAIYIIRLGLPSRWAIAIILFASAGLLVWVLVQTVYRLDNDALHIRSGPFSFRIPLASITAVEPTRNPLSSPALSLDRLVLRYGPGKSCMISPVDKAAFLAELRSRGVSF